MPIFLRIRACHGVSPGNYGCRFLFLAFSLSRECRLRLELRLRLFEVVLDCLWRNFEIGDVARPQEPQLAANVAAAIAFSRPTSHGLW